MMDGRFDQHFLELFATSEDQADQDLQWVPIVFSVVVSLAFGFGALLAA
jgi:hypothetical protein